MTCHHCGAENNDRASSCRVCGRPLTDPEAKSEPLPADVARDASGETPFRVGALVSGRYRLVRLLGEGATGVVWLAADRAFQDQEIALKAIHPRVLPDAGALERFAEEVVACRDLNHPHIVKVFDLKQDGEHRFLTMEYVPGRSLCQEMERRKQAGEVFSLAETVTVISQILEALEHAHTRTVHRDIKPRNVMMVGDFPEVTIKVMDFGLARARDHRQRSAPALILGSPFYLAPEQLGGWSEITPASDLYSVGVIFYEMLTGRVPVGLARPPSVLVSGLPPRVDDICQRALEFQAASRYADAREFLTDLRDLLGVEVPAEPLDTAENVQGRLALVHFLLDGKADPNAHDRWGNTALHWATAHGLTAVVELLCRRGADLNLTEKQNGNTPLHDAADEGRYEAARVLLQAGASTELRNKAGLTPAQLAHRHGHRLVEDLIRKHRH